MPALRSLGEEVVGPEGFGGVNLDNLPINEIKIFLKVLNKTIF
ncbi:MAG: hypothetical protein WC794_01520 [Candidatus Doudnabacteria bacterium]|jgi:hypothetical protein